MGPETPATATTMPNKEEIIGTTPGGQISGYTIMVMEYSPAPPAPCMARKPISWFMFWEAAQAIEAPRNNTKDASRTVFRPRASASRAINTAHPDNTQSKTRSALARKKSHVLPLTDV